MSPSRLDGWEPAETSTFEYDDVGRVVRVVTVREAEFSAEDVEWLLASRRRARIPRGGHGLPLAESTDPAFQYDWEVGLPVTDFAQQKLDAAREAYRKQYPDADMGALLWTVSRGRSEPLVGD